MNKTQEALKMAIEAFELEESTWWSHTKMSKAYQACKEALAQSAQEPVAWMYEDELPSTYPYDVMFQYSAIRDGVRMFPVYVPKHKSNEVPLKQAEKYANGNKQIQTAYEDGFI